jgi:hypothetical protein
MLRETVVEVDCTARRISSRIAYSRLAQNRSKAGKDSTCSSNGDLTDFAKSSGLPGIGRDSKAQKPVQERTLGYLTGAAGTPNYGFDSSWRYHKLLFATGADGVAAVTRVQAARL